VVLAVMPEITLPDYKKIAKDIIEKEKGKKEKFEATEKEVDDVLLQIRKNKAYFDWHKNHPDEKGHNHPDIKDEDLPKLDDNLAKEAGNFKNLAELKEKVKENLIAEKKLRSKDKLRANIIEKLIEKSKMDLPEILVESEIQKSLAQMKDDVERVGMKWEEYLAHTKKIDSSAEALAKAEEELKKDLKDNSEKKAKVQLIFNKIAETEKLKPNQEILDNEIKELKKHYPEASEENIRIFVITTLLNQEVLKLLENQ
jgi:FKBP-type peptidyl-prolyl cis-trans isomerase (trigger factor)